MNGGTLVRGGQKKNASKSKIRRRRRSEDGMEKLAEHVGRRGVCQVSTGMKTNGEGTCRNALLIVWSGRYSECNVKEK